MSINAHGLFKAITLRLLGSEIFHPIATTLSWHCLFCLSFFVVQGDSANVATAVTGPTGQVVQPDACAAAAADSPSATPSATASATATATATPAAACTTSCADKVKVAAGDYHTCLVASDGGVRCYGLNSDGAFVAETGAFSSDSVYMFV